MPRQTRTLVAIAAAVAVALPTIPAAAQLDSATLGAFRWRSIGPANMGGRIVDVDVVESDPKTIYVAAATGGLWKTVDGGDSWKPLFDQQSTLCLGDIAVSQSHPNIVWVGTGEANARNSASWGDGVYGSTDGGQTWKNLGLKTSEHIARILIDPRNSNTVFVAAQGPLWGPGGDRAAPR